MSSSISHFFRLVAKSASIQPIRYPRHATPRTDLPKCGNLHPNFDLPWVKCTSGCELPWIGGSAGTLDGDAGSSAAPRRDAAVGAFTPPAFSLPPSAPSFAGRSGLPGSSASPAAPSVYDLYRPIRTHLCFHELGTYSVLTSG